MAKSEDSHFSKVRAERVHEHIVAQLQHLILSGKLKSGSRLPSEREMMTEFQVSRPTVREALRVAENMGLISVRPGDPGGSKVLATPSLGITHVVESLLRAGRTSVLELIETRIMLDSNAAALACAQPKGRLTPLSELLRQMQNTTDLHAFSILDAKFHEAVIVASGNRFFHIIFQALDEPIRNLTETSLAASHEQGRKEALKHHAAILTAIQNGEARSAAIAVRSHLRKFYLPVLSEQERKDVVSFTRTMERVS